MRITRLDVTLALGRVPVMVWCLLAGGAAVAALWLVALPAQASRLGRIAATGSGHPSPADSGVTPVRENMLADDGAQPRVMQMLLASAQAHGLRTPGVGYDYKDVPKKGYRILLVSMTSHGPYPDLRDFLAEALDMQAALGMDELTIERDEHDAAGVSARIRFFLLVGAQQSDFQSLQVAPFSSEAPAGRRHHRASGRAAGTVVDIFSAEASSPLVTANSSSVPAAFPLPMTEGTHDTATEDLHPQWNVIGKRYAQDRWIVFIEQDGELHVLQEGDTVGNRYRIDRVAPPEMALTHMPTGLPLVVSIGGARP